MNLSERLKNLREQKGFTQEALAAETGLRLATISRLENGHHNPELSTLKALADAYKMRVAEIFKGIDVWSL